MHPYPVTKYICIILTVLAIGGRCQSLSQQQQQYTFQEFQHQFNKTYKNQQQRQKHKQAFEYNYNKFLQYRRDHPTSTSTMAVNYLMDMTSQQSQILFSLKTVPQLITQSTSASPQNKNKKTNNIKLQYPETLDYRDFGTISPVKSQGSCGSCWAFTVAAVYEANLKLQTNIDYDLAEQFLLECDKEQYGCFGGSIKKSLQFLNRYGAPLQQMYPYNGTDSLYEKLYGFCSKLQKNIKLPSQAYHISHAQQISDEEIIYQLITHGPLATGIVGNHPSFLYTNYQGMINDCAQVQNTYFICHAVVLIGYTPTHWIVKNSWGNYWGDQGYGYINRSSNCGIKKQLTLFRTSMYGSLYPEYRIKIVVFMYAKSKNGWGNWTLAIKQKGQIVQNITLKQGQSGNITISAFSHSNAQIIVTREDQNINSSQLAIKVLYSSTLRQIYRRQKLSEIRAGYILYYFCPSICREVLIKNNNNIHVSDLSNIISNISNLQFIFIMASCGLFVVCVGGVLCLFFCSAKRIRYIQFTINNNSKTTKFNSNCIDTEKGFQKQSYNQNQ